MLDAYLMESKEANYPRILIDDCVLDSISDHCNDTLVFLDETDSRKVLNYFRCFGRNRMMWISDINSILDSLCNELEEKMATCVFDDQEDYKKTQSVVEKIQWLIDFAKINKSFWESKT